MTEFTCAFTGHRPKSFLWKYDETALDCVLLKEVLAEQIKALADRGVTDFLSGMALGVDLWCARIVLSLKEKNPALRLHCILPCEGQELKWPASEQEQYHSILRQADEVVYVGWAYHSDCMLERNRYLVDHTARLLAVYNGEWRDSNDSEVCSETGKRGYRSEPQCDNVNLLKMFVIYANASPIFPQNMI